MVKVCGSDDIHNLYALSKIKFPFSKRKISDKHGETILIAYLNFIDQRTNLVKLAKLGKVAFEDHLVKGVYFFS